MRQGPRKAAKGHAPEEQYMRWWMEEPAPPPSDPEFKWAVKIPVLVQGCGDERFDLTATGVFGEDIIGALQNAFVRSPQASAGQLPVIWFDHYREVLVKKRDTTYYPPVVRQTKYWQVRLVEVFDERKVPVPPPLGSSEIGFGPPSSARRRISSAIRCCGTVRRAGQAPGATCGDLRFQAEAAA